MKRVLNAVLLSMLILSGGAQTPQPGQPLQRQSVRLNQMVDRATDPETNNFQLELTIARGRRIARYRVTLNGGQVSTEFIDKLANSPGDARIINLQASLTPFDGGAEASIFLGRPYAWKSKVQDKASGEEKEITNLKSMGLTTKVALAFGKAVVIYDDEDEKISVKLTQL